MTLAIVGAGGVGSYFGAKLLEAGHRVDFVARGEHLVALQERALLITHPSWKFAKKVQALDTHTLWQQKPSSYDGIILLTKSMETQTLAQQLAHWFSTGKHTPYCISLQNGVENESILARYVDPEKIIAGLTRKIGAHVMKPGCVEAIGTAETILGAYSGDAKAQVFANNFSEALNLAGIPSSVTADIQNELWKKLIINNGVNALCALLGEKTGVVVNHPQLFPLVLGLMQETAKAARALHVKISEQDVEDMFALIQGFDSIKPSMLVDIEHRRRLEIDEICGVVLRTLKAEGMDAPYTKTIASLLAYKWEKIQ